MAKPVSVQHISTDSTQKVISHTATGNHVMNSQQSVAGHFTDVFPSLRLKSWERPPSHPLGMIA